MIGTDMTPALMRCVRRGNLLGVRCQEALRLWRSTSNLCRALDLAFPFLPVPRIYF